MSEIITIDLTEAKALTIQGSKLVFEPEAEEALVKLLDMQDRLEKAIEFVKTEIAKQGEALSPGFSGVVGKKIKCTYKTYGAKYALDKEADLATIEKSMLKENTKYTVDSKAVEVYVEAVGGLPQGIHETQRSKTLSIDVIKPKLEEATNEQAKS